MRNEANLIFIKHATCVSNFKNVCQTVAKRHQHLLCYYIHSNLLFREEHFISGPTKRFRMTIQPMNIQQLLHEHLPEDLESIMITSYMTFNGLTYKPDVYVLLKADEIDPVFGRIVMVTKSKSERLFRCKEVFFRVLR